MAREINIQFDEAELTERSKDIEAQIAEATGDLVKKENLELQLVCAKFLIEAKKVLQDIKQFKIDQMALADMRHANKERAENNPPVPQSNLDMYQQAAEKIRTTYVTNRVFEQFFKEMMIFNDHILKIITGSPITTVIIIEKNDGPPEVREYTIQELLEEGSGIEFITDYASKTYALVGRIRIHTDQLQQAASMITEKEQKEKNFSLANLNQAYFDVKKDYLDHLPHVFFKVGNDKQWYKVKVAGGLGDISEAYAAFFFLKKPPFNQSRWPNLTTYIQEGVMKVDSVSGLYAADIQDEENKKNYAVKALNASLPGYAQMIQLANNVLKGTKAWDVKKLREISQKRQYDLKTGLRKGLRNTAEEVWDSIIGEIEGQEIIINVG